MNKNTVIVFFSSKSNVHTFIIVYILNFMSYRYVNDNCPQKTDKIFLLCSAFSHILLLLSCVMCSNVLWVFC